MDKNTFFDFDSILTNNHSDASFTTIGYCFGGISKSEKADHLSFRSLFSFMQLKYSGESSCSSYKKEPVEFIVELLGFEFKSFTPLMLTRAESPFQEAVIQLGSPNRVFLRRPSNVVPYAMLWGDESPLIKRNAPVNLGTKAKSISELALMCRQRSILEGLNLMLISIPGWSFDSFCKNRLSMATKNKLAEAFVYGDRVFD